MNQNNRTREIVSRLLIRWPDPKLELNYSNPFELLIATILAAQCTDVRVNAVTKNFFKDYPTAHKIARENPNKIAEKIKPTGFYRNKAKSIISCCQKLIKDHNGQVPDTVEELTQLHGVGRKTANIVLGNAFDKPVIAVDTHLRRVALRLDLSHGDNENQIEADLMEIIDEDQWTLFSKLMVLHGRYTCQARRPRCPDCVISELCNWEEKTIWIDKTTSKT
jgi:endonuclease-3